MSGTPPQDDGSFPGAPPTPGQPSPVEPWLAEREVDAPTAARLLREAFPQAFGHLSPTDLEPFGAGWDNTAWLVEKTWVFRFPRRQLAVSFLNTESRLLPRIAPLLPLQIPAPEWVSDGKPDAAWPFAGYRMLPGPTACGARLDDEERSALAERLAQFLSTLHALPSGAWEGCGVRPDSIERLSVARRRAGVAERLKKAADLGLIPDPTPWLALLDDFPSHWEPRSCSLVHGDFYVRHLLLDPARPSAQPPSSARRPRLSGIIDWGDAHLGEPAGDLSIAYTFLPPEGRRSFFEAYGDASPEVHQMARFKALIYGCTLSLYGHSIGDEDLTREGLYALDQLRRHAEAAQS